MPDPIERLAKQTRKGKSKAAKFIRRPFGSAPDKVLVATMLVVAVVLTVEQLVANETPAPRQYMAWFAVYLILAMLAEFGAGPARLAAAIAFVSMLYLLVDRRDPIVTALQKLAGASRVVPEEPLAPVVPINQGQTVVTQRGRAIG